MMIVDDLKRAMSMRENSLISGIVLSEYYYVPRSRTVTRLDPSIGKMIKRIAAERPMYGYRRVWGVLPLLHSFRPFSWRMQDLPIYHTWLSSHATDTTPGKQRYYSCYFQPLY